VSTSILLRNILGTTFFKGTQEKECTDTQQAKQRRLLRRGSYLSSVEKNLFKFFQNSQILVIVSNQPLAF